MSNSILSTDEKGEKKEKSTMNAPTDIVAAERYDDVHDIVQQDGIKVHPQPTSDPLDPLNWSRLQKNGILGIVMLK